MSARWTRCAPWQPGPSASRCCSTNWRRRPAMTRAWTPTSPRSRPQLERSRDHPVPRPQGRRGHQPGAAGRAAGPPRPPRGRRGVPGHPPGRAVGRRVRHHADRAGSGADPRAGAGQGMTHAITARRLRQPEDDDLRGHRPGRANHLQPPREGQRDRRRHSAGTGGAASSAPTSTRTCTSSWCPVAEKGFCAGFDLSAYADGTSSAGGGSPYDGHRAGRQDPGRQPPARPAVGPDDRLPDDEPVRPRLLQPDARRQADGGQDPRLLRGRRNRHRAARRPGDRRRRRQDRLPADAGVGCPRGGSVGAPTRRPARQTPSVHR